MGLTPGDPPGEQAGERSAREGGLAALLHGGSDAVLLRSNDKASSEYEIQLVSIATHVLDLHPAQGHLDSSKDLYEGVARALQERADQSRAQAIASPREDEASSSGGMEAGESSSSEGRLGPSRVLIDKASARGSLQYSHKDLAAEGLNNFSSFRANACVYSGKWMYEALIQPAWQPGIQQIGWATIHCPFTAEEGVGDAPDSYAYDGKRVRKWNVKSWAYGEAWAAGDIIGSCLDLDRGEITFYRNGVSMGVAFRNVRAMQPHLAYFPTVSLSYTERCELNFGARPFAHPVESFKPMHAPPREPTLAFVSYLLGCLERLAKTAANSGAGPGSWGAEEAPWADDAADTGGQASASASARKLSAIASSATTSETPVQHFGCTRQLHWTDATLLAGAICTHLMQALMPPGEGMVEHLVHGPLVQSLLRLHGGGEPHDPAAVRAAVRLLQVSMDPKAFDVMVVCLLDALARRCVSAPMVPQDFPYSASYPYLSLVACLAGGVPQVRACLLSAPGLYQLLEAFMARKPPSAEDLKALLPVVWWPGCKEETASEARMRDGLRAFAAAKSRVEDCQYQLLTMLVGQPASSNAQDDSLVAFVRYLVQKNRGATRDVQPPGLSDPNVLLSVWFVLLRLLHGCLDAVPAFPAGELFVRASQRGSIDPTNDLPRLGGLLSYLLRESPVAQRDLGPLPVSLPPPLGALPCDAATRALSRAHGVAAELLHLSTMLYTYRGEDVIRQIRSLAQNLATNQSGLEQVERQLEQRLMGGSGGGAAPGAVGSAASGSGGEVGGAAGGTARPVSVTYLHDARSMLRTEVQTAVRCIRLLESTFFGGWKMEALLRQASWLAAALRGVADQSGPLLAFVPTCYPELLLDMLSAYRSVEAPFAPAAALRSHGLDELLGFVAKVLNDERIRNPDSKEQLLVAAAGLLEGAEMAAVVEANGPVSATLVETAAAVFDSKLWHPVATILAQITRGAGLAAPPPPRPPLRACQALLRGALQPSAPHFKGFCDRLFNTLNWAVTEATSAVATLHEARRPLAQGPGGRRPQVDEQQLTRKVVLHLDLTKSLLRLLEFMCVNVPAAFLSRPCVLNRTRLLEVVPFVLGHFAGGADARRLNELLDASRASAGMPQTIMRVGADRQYTVIHVEKPLYEKVNRAELLVPLVGMLLALWRADAADADSAPGGRGGSGGGFVDGFMDALADTVDARVQSQLDFLKGFDWEAGLPGADAAHLARELQDFKRLVAEVVELRQASGVMPSPSGAGMPGAVGATAAGGGGGGAAGSTPPSPAIPDEFLDPITTSLMMDPVVLPDSGITVDRSTVERQLTISGTDPFSRTELTLEMLKPDDELRERIRTFMAERGASPRRR